LASFIATFGFRLKPAGLYPLLAIDPSAAQTAPDNGQNSLPQISVSAPANGRRDVLALRVRNLTNQAYAFSDPGYPDQSTWALDAPMKSRSQFKF